MRMLRSIGFVVLATAAVACTPKKREVCEHMASVRATPANDRDLWIGYCIDSFNQLEMKLRAQALPEATKTEAQDRMSDGYRCVLRASNQAGLDACAARLEDQMQGLLRL